MDNEDYQEAIRCFESFVKSVHRHEGADAARCVGDAHNWIERLRKAKFYEERTAAGRLIGTVFKFKAGA